MTEAKVLVDQPSERIRRFTLNRPEKRNSMNLDFWNEFPEIISKLSLIHI